MAASISRSFQRLGGIALLLGLVGCGWYTNVPAQIRVQNIEPATVGVVFANNVGQFTNPTITAMGEQGSIGVTYYGLTISYRDSAGSAISALPDIKSNVNLRVEGSFLKSYSSTSGGSTPSDFIPGTGKAVLPIVNQSVLAYATSTSPKPGTITAFVTLDGIDDAQYRPQLKLYIPITFAGN